MRGLPARRKLSLPLLLLGALALLGDARATVTAHFLVTGLDGGCRVDDTDPFPTGDPERRFRIAVFDSSASAVLAACANGCAADANPATLDGSTLSSCSFNEGCGVWDFADQTLVKIVPPLSGVFFYFGLFDEDSPLPADDLLGDHWFFSSGPSSGPVDNNNTAPYKPDDPIATMCRDVQGDGFANNFEFSYLVWFEDSTAPSSVPTPVSNDDGLQTPFENDTTLLFIWSAATDADSGISGYTYTLSDDNTGQTVGSGAASLSLQFTACPAGCNLAYTPLHNHTYSFRVGATNGLFPEIDNPSGTSSSWTQVLVDLASPVSTITSPAAGTWHGGNFSVAVTDSDSGSGLNIGACQWRVVSSGVTTLDWTARTCNAAVNATVGPAAFCRHDGANTCSVSVRSTDRARRVSTIASRAFSIDFSPDTITAISAATQAGGTTIAPSTWQPDNTPFLSWTAAASTAPIAGYSYDWDVAADCISETVSPSADFNLSEGQHLFAVRAIDSAGNCGLASTFALWVDSQADDITDLAAFTEAGGAPIAQSVWQQDVDPFMVWSASTSTAPIAGYSWSIDASADCTVDLAGTSVTIALSEGQHLFRVRPIDDAGNCGIVASYSLYVDATAESIDGLGAFTQEGGTPIPAATWQSDNTPYFAWDAAISTSPVTGYSLDFDQAPDCSVDAVDPWFEVVDALPNGQHLFSVRVVDAAGNCGPEAEFELWVNSSWIFVDGFETGDADAWSSTVP